MARVMKKRRLVNPRRKLSPKQIKFFGTKRQKAALKAKRRRATVSTKRVQRKAVRKVASKRTRRRASNVGEIITIGLNPSPVRRRRKKANMARKRRRRASNPRRRVRSRRRSNPVVRRHYRRRRRSNPVRRRSRSYNVRRRRRGVRRRNPAFLTGKLRDALGVLGGAAATKLIVDRLPYGLATGYVSYLSTAVVAMVLGYGVGKFGKNKPLGDMMVLGGFAYLTLRVLQDFVPSIAAISPIGLRGMGVIGPGSMYVPQVPRAGGMRNFVTPAAVTAATAGMSGLGMNRRFARVR